MVSHKVELLAPAGNYDSFIGALNAGADAIYVGGEKFSARAFADNFDTETLCRSIRYAHLFGRRVYLTLNTLIKESEFSELYDYVKPFYMAGLDGVIVQDFGVLRFLREHFPYMELHASTQMAVTGPEFVSMCRELGISRVVPARELSLKELKKIKDAGIEVECFVHGAMCYCYSGMCLMSSILGGRSGNRGKCAQPCRLPYQVALNGQYTKATYTLSLKDMCTIEHIPKLIEAGMDSFKIEGRMKRSEYAAGVTALYRKYIDRYYQNPDQKIQISKEDKHVLEHLYMRSELHDGYLNKANGREMVTKQAPSYSGLEESILADIREKYLGYTLKIPVSAYGYFEVGQACVFTVYTKDGNSVTVQGPIVEPAQKAAASEESVSKQLCKFGSTHFELENIEISIQGQAFLPNGVLNALRRDALEQLEEQIISTHFPEIALRRPEENTLLKSEEHKKTATVLEKQSSLTVLVKNGQQLRELCAHALLSETDTLYMEDEAMDTYLAERRKLPCGVRAAYAMPYILRSKDHAKMKDYLRYLFAQGITTVLVRNVEELALIRKLREQLAFAVVSDASLYCWNRKAQEVLSEYVSRITLPFELNSKELRLLRTEDTEQIIYGYIPMMITANCIFKTNAECRLAEGGFSRHTFLKDRYGKVFAVVTNCKYCYNTIYNSVPLSLHKKYNKNLFGTFRLQFGKEDAAEVKQILDYYEKWIQDIAAEFPVKEYTTAHENRQVE